MKKVLLIGDSIRLGYEPVVKNLLSEKADVFSTQDNCRFTLYTLWHLHQWVEDAGADIDVVHWNNGIWDMYTHLHDNASFSSVSDYASALKRIISEIRSLCPKAKIIFATTTAVNDNHPHMKNANVDIYNQVAITLMKAEGIEINDLNSLIKNNPELICDDLLHLSEDGYAIAGKAVAKFIEKSL